MSAALSCRSLQWLRSSHTIRRVPASTVLSPHSQSPLSLPPHQSSLSQPHRSLSGWRRREGINPEPIPPNYTIDSIQPPDYFAAPPEDPPDPMACVRKPVTSAQLIDVDRETVSERDRASLTPDGRTVVHGVYGELPRMPDGVPLEYLALLRPSAEGVAAVNAIVNKGDGDKGGTLLVFGASQPGGLAATQLANAKGCTVVAVVGGEHSGNEDMCDIVKGLTDEPGCMVPEEYAMIKQRLRDLVRDVNRPATTTASMPAYDQSLFLQDFQQNLLDYVATYPDTLPAAVEPEELVFKGKDKDRTYFRENMEAYLSQFPKGAPAIPEQDLLEKFSYEQYVIFKRKFHDQATNLISGDEVPDLDVPGVVKTLMTSPETSTSRPANTVECGEDGLVPFHFDVTTGPQPPLPPALLQQQQQSRAVLGAVICVTPFLQSACEKLAEVNPQTLRERAEALQFLSVAERNAYAAAASVCALAPDKEAIYVVGGSGTDTVINGLPAAPTPTDEDVQEAIRSMEIDYDDDESATISKPTSKLNYFVQVYRAGDFPVYADYAVHRATEALAGPRQVVVTK